MYAEIFAYLNLCFIVFTGQGFADKRKKKIQYEYLKVLKKEGRKYGERRHMNHEEETDSPNTERLKYNIHSQVKTNKTFQSKIVNIFLPIIFSICFGCSKEPSH